jgi:integrase/recombinase XerD
VAGQAWTRLATMFKSLFQYPRVLLRHADGPMAAERSTFITHLAQRSASRSTLLRYARQLRVIALILDRREGDHITAQEITRYGRRWAQRQHQLGRAQSLKWPAAHFVQVACAWYRFMGRLREEPRRTPAYARRLEAWTSFLRAEDLAESTIGNYRWWANHFLQWLTAQGASWRAISLFRVDEYMKNLSFQKLNRVSLATAAKVLRRFARYGFQQGWCRRDLAPAILSPHLFQHENLPCGPAWPDVQRLVEATKGATNKDRRNRAILLLLAVYGLRSGEVTALRLEDVDWSRRVLRVRRSKTARLQEYPLTSVMHQALDLYLKKARPKGDHCEVFLSLRAPHRPLTGNGVYGLTRSLLDRLNIASPKRGPHSLRHACASYLLNSGSSLKQVGDHLGHRTPSATQIYAKVDLIGLRAAAAFDLGGLL